MFGIPPFWKSRLLAALLTLVIGLPAAAQAGGRRPFALLGPDEGLPSGAIISLAQDRDGFLWLGSENGLLRYEGGQCRQWTPEDGLPSAYIQRILPDPQGGIWVATLRGLVHFQGGRFEPVTLGDPPGQVTSTLIALDRQGRLWAANRLGLFRQEEDRLRLRRLSWTVVGPPTFLALGQRSGAMYLADASGLTAFQSDGSTRSWNHADGLPREGVSLLVEDGRGRLWTGSGRHLKVLAPGESAFRDASARLPGTLSVNGVPFCDPDGSVWLPTQAGALHLDGDRTEVLDAAVGLPFRWVRAVFRDREGSLWVLGPALARLQGGGRVRNFTLSHGAFGEVVWYITPAPDGGILVATDDGAARMGPEGLVPIPGTEGRRIKGLALDAGGTLWMVTTIGPTLWLRPGQRQVEVAPLGEWGTSVNTVFKDREGRIWLGSTRHGVLRWDPAARRLVEAAGPSLAGLPALGAYAFSEDGQGRLWVGSTAGLLLRGPEGRWRLFTEKDGLQPYTVYGAAFLPDGSAWLNYQEPQGLTRVRLEGDRLKVLEHRTRGQGLRSNLIYAVQVDRRGQTWLTTDQGLDRLEPPLHVGRHEGMASEDCAILSLLTENGKVWVGTAGGLVRYDAEAPVTPLPPPQAHILQLEAGPRRLDPPVPALAPLPAREGTLVFRFAAPSYASEQDLRFQVRLLGLEDAWRDTESRAVRYPALPAGHYRFEVRAALGDGPFGPPQAIDFDVRPPWWQTWWARALGGLALLGAMYGAFRIRLAALARSKAELEAQVAARTAELQARNAELSEALGNVKQLSGLLPICASCKKIRDDKGYWNQLEHYISQHTEADFSHGICPDCARDLFPEAARHRKGS